MSLMFDDEDDITPTTKRTNHKNHDAEEMGDGEDDRLFNDVDEITSSILMSQQKKKRQASKKSKPSQTQKSSSSTQQKSSKRRRKNSDDDDDMNLFGEDVASASTATATTRTARTTTQHNNNEKHSSKKRKKDDVIVDYAPDVIDLDEVVTMIRIVNAHTNQSFTIEKPRRFSQLEEQMCKLFQIRRKDIEQISNLMDCDVKSDSQLMNESTNTILLYLKGGSSQNSSPSTATAVTATTTAAVTTTEAKTKVTTEADIMPHVNILIHGGDEYDFITALAELIDNSIQNTCMNSGERIIDIFMDKTVRENDQEEYKLHIWDNGRGMDYNGVVEWARMGVTRPPPINKDMLLSMPKSRTDMYLTNDFSRYGVGSKKAIFNLGDQVTMCSRARNQRLVTETTLSKAKLEADFERGKQAQWKINVDSRTPSEQEANRPSFTHITISNLKEVYVAKYDSATVRRQLGHIYHYYLFGPKGNKGRDLENDHTEDEEEERDIKGYMRNVTIRVDGKSIKSKPENDLESMYLQLGANPWTFDLRVTATVRDFDTDGITQVSQARNKIQSNVKGVLLYFPYRNGKETLPIPNQSVYDDNLDEIPLSERDPGFECFWNGRLLSGEKSIKNFPFMIKDKTRDIPDVCYRRIKGMLFLDSAFEVSANKLYLCKQTPLCQALIQYDDRKLKSGFKKWLKSCHMEYDEEIKYGEIDSEETNKHQRGVTFYRDVTYGSQKYQVGTKVSLSTRPKVIGTITAIFLDASSQDYGCSVVIQEYNGQEEAEDEDTVTSTHNISKIEKILSAADFKKEKEKMSKRKPSHIDLMETTKVPINQKLPPVSPVEAGFVLKYITVGIFCGDNKVHTKDGAITLKITNETTQKEYPEITSHQPMDKSGRHCFKPTALIPKFIEAGKYIFEFSSDKLKSKLYSLVVTPAAPHHLSPTDCTDLELSLGIPSTISSLNLADQYENKIDLADVSVSAKEVVVNISTDTLTLSNEYVVSIEEKWIVVNNVIVTGGTLNGESSASAQLLLSYGQLEQKLRIPVSIKPGIPKKLEFTAATRDQVSSSPVVREVIKMELYAVDSWNNKIFNSGNDTLLKLRAEGPDLESSCVVSLNEKGLFEFVGEKTLVIREDTTKTEEYNIQLTFVLLDSDDSICIFDNKPVSSSVRLTVSPGSQLTPSAIKIYPRSGQESFVKSTTTFSANIEAVVSEELSEWRLQLLDHNRDVMTSFNGICLPSWDKSKCIVTNGECKLPVFVIPTVHDKKTELRLSFRPNEEDEDNSFIYRMEVTSIIGKPVKLKHKQKGKKQKIVKSCCESFHIDFTLQDTFGNEYDMQKHHESHEEVALISPIVTLEPVEKDAGSNVIPMNQENMELRITSEGVWRLQNVQFKGPKGQYVLSIKDSAKIAKSAKVNFELNAGPPVSIKVNDLSSPTFSVINYGTLPTLTVAAYDEYGNVVSLDESAAINMDDSSGFEILHCTGSSAASMESDDQGRYVIPQLRVIGAPGKHKFTLEFEKIELQIDIAIDLQPSPFHPTTIEILNKISKQVCAGTTIGPFEIMVRAENGQNTRTPRPVVLEVEAPDEKRIHTSIPPHTQVTQDFTYKFPDSEKFITKSGPYRYKFYADLGDLPYGSQLNEDKVVQEMAFIVTNGAPSKIDTRPTDFQLPAVTNSDDPSRMTFFEELTVVVVDDYHNIATDCTGIVSLSVESTNGESANVPLLEGQLQVEIQNGRAKFRDIKLKPNSGKSGLYKLVFSSDDLNSKELEFCFTDDSVLLEKQNKLHQKRLKILEKITEQENTLEQAKIRYEEASRLLSNYDREVTHIGEELEQLSPDFKNKDWQTENIDKLIVSVKKKLLSKKKKSQSIRSAKFGLEDNPSLQHVLKLKEQDGESSDIVGILADLGFVEDETLDKIISKQFGALMQLVIVNNRVAADKLKKQMEKLPKITILPLDNMAMEVKQDNNGMCLLEDLSKFSHNGEDETNDAEENGFIGYVCNMIQLQREHIHLRPAFFTIVKDCAVFKTYDLGMQFRRQRLYAKKRCPKIITLDGQTIESQGFIYAGKDNSAFPYRFGQLSLSSDPYFTNLNMREEKLNQMKKTLEKRRIYFEGEYAEAENEFKQIEKSVRKELNDWKQKHHILQERLRKLSMGGTHIEEVEDDIEVDDSDKIVNNSMNDDELLDSPPSSAKRNKKSKAKKASPTEKISGKKRSSRSRPRSPDLFAEEPGGDEITEFSDVEDQVENWSSDDDHKAPSFTPTTKATRSQPKRKRSRKN